MEDADSRVEAETYVERQVDRKAGEPAVPADARARITKISQRKKPDERVEIDLAQASFADALVNRNVVSDVETPRELAEVVVLDGRSKQVRRRTRVELHLEKARWNQVGEIRDVEEVEEGRKKRKAEREAERKLGIEPGFKILYSSPDRIDPKSLNPAQRRKYEMSGLTTEELLSQGYIDLDDLKNKDWDDDDDSDDYYVNPNPPPEIPF